MDTAISSDKQLLTPNRCIIFAVAALTVSLGTSACSTDDAANKTGRPESAGVPTSTVNEAMVDCMASHGWDGTVELGGGMDYGSVPPEQEPQFSEHARQCVDETGWGDLEGLTAAQRKVMYDRELDEYECIKELGLTPPEPPTEQTYLDTFASGDQYYAVKGIVLTQQQTNACPPPTWFMNW